jgi:hypothetical protein
MKSARKATIKGMDSEQWQEPNDDWQDPGDNWALPHSALLPLRPQVAHGHYDGPAWLAFVCVACGMPPMMAMHMIFENLLSPSALGESAGLLWLLSLLGTFAAGTVLTWIIATRH